MTVKISQTGLQIRDSSVIKLSRHQPSLLHFIGMVIALLAVIGCGTARKEEHRSSEIILMRTWLSADADSLFYIDDSEKIEDFKRYWKPSKGQDVSLACGYTYDLFRTQNRDSAKWFAAANVLCSTVVDSLYTYFNQIHLIDSVKASVKLGVIVKDTVSDPKKLTPYIEKLKLDDRFLGWKRASREPLLLASFKWPRRGDLEASREDFYSSIAGDSVSRSDLTDFDVCDSSIPGEKEMIGICGVAGQSLLTKIEAGGHSMEKRMIGIPIETYWTRRAQDEAR